MTHYQIVSGKVDGANCSTATEIIAAVTGKVLAIRSIFISASNAATVHIEDNSGTPVVVFPKTYLAANGGATHHFVSGAVRGTAGQALMVKSSTTDPVSVIIEAEVLE